MGFFSWRTMDTNRSICNIHSGRRAFSVTMTDNEGNKWHEKAYDGYGIFGGKDFYELLAEMNGKEGRDAGIAISYGKEPFLSPNLTENPTLPWKNRHPMECEEQGFFYNEGGE